jgi:NTP pyrophosphatase (non-canonical NTP hydrolase)
MSRINDALWDLREAYRAEPNPARKQQLQDEYDRALAAVLELTDKVLGDNTAAYNKAVDGLDKSITDLRKAKKELGDVAAAVNKIAKAVDVMVKVARQVMAG